MPVRLGRVTLLWRRALFNRKLIENRAPIRSSFGISNRVLIIGLALWLGAGGWSRAATPADLAPLRKQLATAEESGDKRSVIELSRRIVALAPNDAAIWGKLAQTELEIEDYDRAKETLGAWEKAMKSRPAVLEDLRGDLALAQKDYENAEKHWLAFLARKPPDAADVYDKLGILCAVQKRWADCEKYDAKAVVAKDSAARRVTHATVLLRLRQWDAAFAEIEKANKIDSADAAVKEWLPQFERLRQFLGAIKNLDAQIAKSPSDATLWLDRARLLTLGERPLLALDDCEQAMKLQPALMRARIQKGEALLDTGEPDEAAKLQVGPNLARDKDKHVAEHWLRALASADAEAAQNPNNAEPLAARAKTLRELRQTALALAEAEAALKLNDKSAAAHLEAAHAFDTLKRSKEALQHAVRATELNANDGEAWVFRGSLEAQRAKYAEALESFTRALALGESLEARLGRENCARRLGKVAEADADLKRIRELEKPKE